MTGIETIPQTLRPTGANKTVTTSGTAEVLVAASTPVKLLYARAKATNTGNVFLGDSNVDKTTSQQIILAAGAELSLTPPDGNQIDLLHFYLDVATNGDGIDMLYLQ